MGYGGADATVETVSLATAFFVYFLLAVGVGGLSIPMGLFVPILFLGGVTGRLLRNLVAITGFDAWPERYGPELHHLARTGIYAIAGF